MSGGHDKSILGVARGDYDMAAIASDVLERMVSRGNVKAEDFRILYTSDIFPTSGYVLRPRPEAGTRRQDPPMLPRLQDSHRNDRRSGTAKIVSCPMTYKDRWAVVREVAEKTGLPSTRATFEVETKREEEAAKRRQQQKQQQQQPARRSSEMVAGQVTAAANTRASLVIRHLHKSYVPGTPVLDESR